MTTSREEVFNRLRQILNQYEKDLTIVHDTADNYYLDAGIYPVTGKVTFFGSVQSKKNYVSYYLMPVYIFPELLQGMSEKLQKRMQGKSCFNFTKIDEELFSELTELTRKGYEQYRENGIIPEG